VSRPPGSRGLGLLLVAVLLAFTAQQMLVPLLAPLARELALSETSLGLVITLAATVVVLASPVWGRAVDRLGRRRVLVLGLALAGAGLLGFAAVSAAGLDDRLGPGPVLGLFLLTRGVLFGAGIAAVPVVALAWASATTEGESERTRAVGLVGAAQGLSLVLGAAVGGALAAVTLLLPLLVAPTVLLATLLAVHMALPAEPAVAPAEGPRVRLSPWDRRLLALLGVGFVLHLSLALLVVVLGFLVADRLGRDAEGTAGAVGLALTVTGLVLVATQGAIVPTLRWPALRLLRVGLPLAAAAFGLLTTAGALWSITACLALLALGLGLAIPGYTTAPTLLVEPAEAGAVSGLVSATNALSFVVGPLLGTALYERAQSAPLLLSLVLCLASWAWVLGPRARAWRSTSPGPDTPAGRRPEQAAS